MKQAQVLVIGASGNTGKILVLQLLQKNIKVVAIVRNKDSFTPEIASKKDLTIVEANIDEVSDRELERYISMCEATISCLGHNVTFKGIFGNPRLLVTNAIKKVVRVIENTSKNEMHKIILMSSVGVRNQEISEKILLAHRIMLFLIRLLIPPHLDNEKAAGFLQLKIGRKHKKIEWTILRPDSLVVDNQITPYDIVTSPTSSIFYSDYKTSRMNVADFMSKLIIDTHLWDTWKASMPVIYNR